MSVKASGQPSPSLLVYLFADRLVERHDWKKSSALKAPCTDVEVSKQAAANLCMAVAYWNLRERGIIGLEHRATERRALDLSDDGNHVLVTLIEARDDVIDLEVPIVRRLRTNPTGEWVQSQIVNVDWDSRDPHNHVLNVVWTEAIARGLGRMEKLGAFKRMTRFPKFQPDCERIRADASLDAAYRDLHNRWSRFAADEPAVYSALVKDCASGLDARAMNRTRLVGSATSAAS